MSFIAYKLLVKTLAKHNILKQSP